MLRKFPFAVLAVGAAMVLAYLIDDNLGVAWPTNVVRNWQEFGFLNLHGQLVANSGGFEVAQNPKVYGGMSPVCLYPAFFATQLFSWTGLDTLSFQILLAAVVFWASWRLLGRDNFALMAAGVAILCPGYLRWPKILDPNTLAALPVLPYAVLVLAILKKPKMTPTLAGALIVLTLAFMSLNWTTAWVCAPCVFMFLAIPGLNRRALGTLIAVMVVAIPLVVVGSFAAKYGHHGPGAAGSNSMAVHSSASSGGLLSIIAGYTWGSGGYGNGTSTAHLFLRLAFTNIVGLLPLWLICLYALIDSIRAGRRVSGLVFVPLAFAVLNMIIMRNYFCHHPWMAGPVLLVGVVFSLAVLRISPVADTASGSDKMPLKIVYGAGLVCFVYGFAVLMFFRANESDLLSLVKLVRQHTARSDTIAILKSDSVTSPLVDRLDEPLDRHVIEVDNINDLANQGHAVILSAIQLNDSPTLIAQSAAASQSWLTRVADWFNHSISHRRAGDRIELPGVFYLYAPRR
ncbi:MAG TPA: hypothetical protein VMF08_21120 [Candidatus Sulfotelmatobacter sp.]|nr:hypothetical protein [Candidatus Sulfotelmatobacter sp.]